jgi:cardiolipin synthase
MSNASTMLTQLIHLWPILAKIPTPLVLAYDLVVLGVIVLAVVRRRGFSSTLAWIFAIIAFPGVGPIAYLLLANPHVARTRRAKKAATRELRHHQKASHGGAASGASRLSDVEKSVVRLAERLSDIPAASGNRAEILSSNVVATERIRDAIARAQKSIWAEFYLIHRDSTGDAFLRLLARKAREGVDVRLLYDAVGSWGIDGPLLKDLREAGGRVEEFLPVNPLRKRWAVHLRNHRKLLVVDGELAMTGGMNIGDEYSGGFSRRVKAWRDTLLVLHGPAAAQLGEVFAEDWSFATDTEELLDVPPCPFSEPGGCLVAVLPSGPDQEANANRLGYFAGITSTVSRCYIASPYFIPDGPTVRALVTASLRGADVRVLVPEKNDIFLMGPAARSYYAGLVQAGVRIYEYRLAMLHSKTMTVDGRWCLIGSANMDVRSFWLNFEISALVFDPAFTKLVEEQFLRDLEGSREITLKLLEGRGFFEALGQGLARLMSPLL